MFKIKNYPSPVCSPIEISHVKVGDKLWVEGFNRSVKAIEVFMPRNDLFHDGDIRLYFVDGSYEDFEISDCVNRVK